ncbi:hypothetical protein [Streptacidiphilus jiangxiensis]|uniref:Uncharacterized protein n=1 Tax=Streptacidiphilus jiangxiensis TaxID=235985 RepID=A0A1H8B944_STRJI|nr:hypothetical protein [Streptacidiphilus jiangxiensis]SEM78919.1 hypothetical protein SAMN05414137_1594 [Streptacidiphilus jiangxiensis]
MPSAKLRPLPAATQDAGSETARLVSDLVETAAADNDRDLLSLIEQARTGGLDAGVAAVLTTALVRNAARADRLTGGAPDMGALTLTRPQDLAQLHLADNPLGADPAYVRLMGGRAREVMQRAATLVHPLPDADREHEARKVYTEEFGRDRDVSGVVLRLLTEACVPVLHGTAADALAESRRLASYLDKITGRGDVEHVLEEVRRDGVDLEELQRAAADRIGREARRINGAGPGQEPADRARVEGLNALVHKIRAAEHRDEDDERMLDFITLLMEGTRTWDRELVAAVTEVVKTSKLVPNVVGTLLSNVNRACPDDARRPDGCPNLLDLSGTADRERFQERTARAGDPDAPTWETSRATVELLESATAQIAGRGHQGATMAVLRKGFADAPQLEAPALRIAAELAALCMASLDHRPDPGHRQTDTDGFSPSQAPAGLVLPPQPVPGGRGYEGDPADFGYEQQVASRVPRWRNRMLRHLSSPETAVRLAGGVDRMTLTPAVASRLTAAQIVIGQETRRLENGRVYHLNPRLTRLATAERDEPRHLPVTWDRIPARTGFMAFALPIAALADQPIVAVSWGPWSAGWEPHHGARPANDTIPFDRPVWRHQHPHPDQQQRQAYFHGTSTSTAHQGEEHLAGLVATSPREWLWVTFYAAHPDNDVPLAWRAETVVPIGAHLPEDTPATSLLSWLRTLLAVWDRLTDPAPRDVAAVVQEIRVARPDTRTKTRRGRKKPTPRTDTVSVVTDRDIPRPPATRPADPPVLPAPRPEPQFGVMIQTKGTQNHCFAPRGEHRRYSDAGQECPHHRDIPLKSQYRRYPDLELRPTHTVHKPE